jgi:hypothetical protein
MDNLIENITAVVGAEWLNANNVILTPTTLLSDLEFDYVDCAVLAYLLKTHHTIDTSLSLQELTSYTGKIGSFPL